MDDDRLKQAGSGGYFDELLARIRDIRSSEKVFWRKVLDLYATSSDYDGHAAESQKFFATVQNKMHWAAHGHTAAEIISQRADATKPNMGMTNFPGERPRKADIGTAKKLSRSQRKSGGAQFDCVVVSGLWRVAGEKPEIDDHEGLRIAQGWRPFCASANETSSRTPARCRTTRPWKKPKAGICEISGAGGRAAQPGGSGF